MEVYFKKDYCISKLLVFLIKLQLFEVIFVLVDEVG